MLGAPPAPRHAAATIGLVAIVVVIALLLPLFGVSLVAVLSIERLVLRRLPGTRHWLGLRPV
jgi:uncharacterized iron-regulated membrane protein